MWKPYLEICGREIVCYTAEGDFLSLEIRVDFGLLLFVLIGHLCHTFSEPSVHEDSPINRYHPIHAIINLKNE